MNFNVPPKTAGEEELFEFAQAFDGYEHWGEDALRCLCEREERFVRSGELPEGPADLRATLFLAWRAYARSGGPGPFSEHGSLTSLFYAVLERLRKVEEVLKAYTRLRDGTVLEVMTIDWPHPHQPAKVWHRFRNWKDGPTPNQLERARQQILASKKYFFRCKVCQEICDAGHRHSKDICQGCASERFGAVY